MKRIALFAAVIIFVFAANVQATWIDDHLFDEPGVSYDLIWDKHVTRLCKYTKVVLVSKDRPEEVVLAPCLDYIEDDMHGPAWVTWHIAANPSTGLPMRVNENYWSYEKWLAFTSDGQLYYKSGAITISKTPTSKEEGK